MMDPTASRLLWFELLCRALASMSGDRTVDSPASVAYVGKRFDSVEMQIQQQRQSLERVEAKLESMRNTIEER